MGKKRIKMNNSQKSCIKRHFSALVENMLTKHIYQYLYTEGCITRNQYNTLESLIGNAQAIELIEIIKRIDDGWNNFIKALEYNNQSDLVNLLNNELVDE